VANGEKPPPRDRQTVYSQFVNGLLAGQDLTTEQLKTLAYGYFRDAQVTFPIGYTELQNRLEAINPTMSQQLDQAASVAESIDADEATENIVAALGGLLAAGLVAGGTAGVVAAGGGPQAAAYSALAKQAGVSGAGIASRIGIPGALSAVAKWLWAKKGKVALGTGLLASGYGIATGGEEQPPLQTQPDGSLSPTTSAPYILTDPATGESTQIPREMMDQQYGVAGTSTDAADTGNVGADLQALLESLGLSTALSGLGGTVSYDPQGLGAVKIDEASTFRGGKLPPPSTVPGEKELRFGRGFRRFVEGLPTTTYPGRFVPEPRPSQITKFTPQGEEVPRLPPQEITGGFLPGGAQINPGVFRQEPERGQTLLEVAGQAASDYGVPLSVIYGIVNQMSGWNPGAIGAQGTAFGLAQLSDKERGQNPTFSLRLAAARLRNGFNQFGSWEASILAFKDPEKAKAFVASGRFTNSVDQAFVLNVLNYAQGSGLSNQIFDLEAVAAAQAGGGGGVTIPPFVEPDKATLRTFAMRAIEESKGRKARPDELAKAIDTLMAGYKEAYSEQVKRIRGSTSVDVDPEARFVEELQQSGEAQFREDVRQERSMSDFVGGIARLLGAGF